MKNDDENGVFTNPRLTASAVRAFLYEEDEKNLEFEMGVEHVLNSVFEAINEIVERHLGLSDDTDEDEDEDVPQVDFVSLDFGDCSKETRLAVLDRLADLGYVNYTQVSDEEEEQHVRELSEMALTDEKVKAALDDYYNSETKFFISWEKSSDDTEL